MKGLDVTIGRLRQLVLALVGREEVRCVSGSGGGTADDNVGEAMREMLRELNSALEEAKGGKETGRKEVIRDGRRQDRSRREGLRRELRRVKDEDERDGDGTEEDGSEGDGKECDWGEGLRSEDDRNAK